MQNFYNRNLDVRPQGGIDSRTGLYNVDALNFTLDQIIIDMLLGISSENKIIYSLMMCDINDLKKVNDRFGHNVGDDNIKAISEIIRGCTRHEKEDQKDNVFVGSLSEKILELLRPEELSGELIVLTMDRLKEIIKEVSCCRDIIYKNLNEKGNETFRIGGDEFLIILKDCTKENAEIVRQRIIESINARKEKDEWFKVSLAIGIADTTEYIPADIKGTIENEVERLKYFRELKYEADKRMYIEKNAMKEQLPSKGKSKDSN